ncbi:class I SAM-dependent methyltransferase [Candidatus Woesearchaeota archaeon]|nr:class I SAM-dependent methyltransferase [Candidatus Woesearchaeota archaeon]
MKKKSNQEGLWESYYKNYQMGPWETTDFDYSLKVLLENKQSKSTENELSTKQSVLDVGCGTGRNCKLMRDLGFDVTGIDISKTAIEKAKKVVKCHVMSSLNMNFKKCFQLVVDYGCLHSCKGDEVIHLRNVWNALEPDGLYILRVFSDNHPLKDAYELFHKLNIGFYSKSRITKLVKRFFKIVHYGPDIERNGKNKNFHLFLLKPLPHERNVWGFPEISFKRNLRPIIKHEIAVHINDKNYQKDCDITRCDSKIVKIGRFDATRIYYGNEFCSRIKPDIRVFKNNDIAITLLTPLIPEEDLKSWVSIIKDLSVSHPNSEVVFNDWGILNTINEYGLKPVLGRLLVRQKNDPRTIRLKSLVPNFRNFMECSLSSKAFIDFLLQNGIRRVELSNTLQGIYVPKDAWKRLKITLHIPDVPISVTRMCMFAGGDKPSNNRNFGIIDCAQECRSNCENPDTVKGSRDKSNIRNRDKIIDSRKRMILDDISMPYKLFLEGNVQYYENYSLENISVSDRLVFHPKSI